VSRQSIVGVLVASCVAISGCAMCCETHDYEYAGYGGCPDRVDRVCGRVGSITGRAEGSYGIVEDPFYEIVEGSEYDPGHFGAD